MIQCDHRFVLLCLKQDGGSLGQLPLSPNWEPAVEWTAFAAQRAGCREARADGRVCPVIDDRLGQPYTSGFRVELEGARLAAPVVRDFPVTYFSAEARRASAALVAQKQLAEGDKFYYRLLAFPQGPASPQTRTPSALDIGEEACPLPLLDAPLAPLLAGSIPSAEGDEDLHPVFIPQVVLDEARELTAQAGALEVGGILLGRLQRDAALPDIGVVVTAQIPARHAVGEADKLTFTAETWAAVEAAVALRRSDELIVGWWHSHPARYWCATKKCSAEARRACSLQAGFFSADDISLHENVFPKAFHVALVITHADDGFREALYGWDQGTVQRRGFRLLTGGGTTPLGRAAMALPQPAAQRASDASLVAAPEPEAERAACGQSGDDL